MDTLVAIVFLGVGIWTFVNPQSAVSFKIKLLKSIGVDMKLSATPKAYQTLKYVGLGIAIVGFLLYFK